jgi:hypothetical protein
LAFLHRAMNIQGCGNHLSDIWTRVLQTFWKNRFGLAERPKARSKLRKNPAINELRLRKPEISGRIQHLMIVRVPMIVGMIMAMVVRMPVVVRM